MFFRIFFHCMFHYFSLCFLMNSFFASIASFEDRFEGDKIRLWCLTFKFINFVVSTSIIGFLAYLVNACYFFAVFCLLLWYNNSYLFEGERSCIFHLFFSKSDHPTTAAANRTISIILFSFLLWRFFLFFLLKVVQWFGFSHLIFFRDVDCWVYLFFGLKIISKRLDSLHLFDYIIFMADNLQKLLNFLL